MAVNIHITIIELNALHTKRQNLFQELDAVIHLLMEAKHWGLRKRSEERFSRNAETDLVCRLLLEKKNLDGQQLAADDEGVVGADAEGERLVLGRAGGGGGAGVEHADDQRRRDGQH